MERSKAGTKEISPDVLSLPNQYTILINLSFIRMEKKGQSNSISKMGTNNQKITHPPLENFDKI